MRVAPITLLLPVLTGLLVSQQPEPTLAEALARMQAGDFPAAAKMLESVTRREPQNGRAWRNLGAAYDQLKDPDHAIEAYRHALEVQPAMIGPTYSIAISYA